MLRSISITAFLLQTPLDWDQDFFKKTTVGEEISKYHVFSWPKTWYWSTVSFTAGKELGPPVSPQCSWQLSFEIISAVVDEVWSVCPGPITRHTCRFPLTLSGSFPGKINKAFVEFWWILSKHNLHIPYFCPALWTKAKPGQEVNKTVKAFQLLRVCVWLHLSDLSKYTKQVWSNWNNKIYHHAKWCRNTCWNDPSSQSSTWIDSSWQNEVPA